MMMPMNEDIERSGSTFDLDDSVAGASASSIETMMRQALEALRWKRENPDQPLPEYQIEESQPPIPTKIDITSNGDAVDDTASSSASEVTKKRSSFSSSSHRSNCGKCGRGTLLSLLSVLIAIVCILAISISMSGGGVDSNDSTNAHALEQQNNNKNTDKEPNEVHDIAEEVPSDMPETPSGESSTTPIDECNTPCTQDSDCNDPTNAIGLNEACGDLMCVSGVCQFEAWNNAAPCAETNYLHCRGDDAMCIRGPRNLNYEGTCSGFQNEECVYRWCPTKASEPDLTSSPQTITFETVSPSTEPPESNSSTVLGECGTPCTQTSDCHDPLNTQGLDQACGSLSCVSGKCQFEAWNDTEECISTNFAKCSGENMACNKGPNDLKYEGGCNGFANIVCVYHWCPGIRRL